MKIRRLLLLAVITVLTLGALQVAFAADFFKELSSWYDYDGSFYTYHYNITISKDQPDTFGCLLVNTQLESTTDWYVNSPSDWFAARRQGNSPYYTAYWRAFGSGIVDPKKLTKDWTYDFQIVTTNAPVAGSLTAKTGRYQIAHTYELDSDGADNKSKNGNTIYVPSSVYTPTTVPEPGTIVAAMAVLSPAALIFRRKKA